MRLLLGAHTKGLALAWVVETRLLGDGSAGAQHLFMARDFVLQCLTDKAERIDVLDFSLGAERLLTDRTNADVGIAAQGTFLHIAVADAGVQDDFLQAS